MTTAYTVLIIDNDESMVAALSTRLSNEGYDCVTAASGMQGLATFQSHHPDLVITDLNMPAGDGVGLAESIREISNVPIVIITGFRDEFRRKLRSIPDVTILQKPFETARLVELVETELMLKHSAACSK